MTAVAIIASLAAGRFGRKIPDNILERGFPILALVIAVYVALLAGGR